MRAVTKSFTGTKVVPQDSTRIRVGNDVEKKGGGRKKKEESMMKVADNSEFEKGKKNGQLYVVRQRFGARSRDNKRITKGKKYAILSGVL